MKTRGQSEKVHPRWQDFLSESPMWAVQPNFASSEYAVALYRFVIFGKTSYDADHKWAVCTYFIESSAAEFRRLDSSW